MGRSVARDVLDGFVERVDDPHCDHEISVLGRPVGVGRFANLHLARKLAHPLVSAHLHAGFRKLGNEIRDDPRCDGRMDQNRFGGVAGRRILRFRIDRDPERLCRIRRLVDVDVAEAFGVPEHGNRRVQLDVPDEGVRPTRNDEVDESIGGQQRRDVFAAAEQRKDIGRHTARPECFTEQGEERRIRFRCLAAALQQGTVAAHHCKGRNLDERIRARFEDDADDTYGAGNTCQSQPVVELARKRHDAERILESSDLSHAFDHAVEFAAVQFEPLEHRERDVSRLDERFEDCNVARIGREDALAIRIETVGERLQNCPSSVDGESGKLTRGSARSPGCVVDPRGRVRSSRDCGLFRPVFAIHVALRRG